MIRVNNKKCIRNLSIKSLIASKTRNIIAIFAITLTTVLFTALFTITMSINASIQQANFRQVGGFSHGSFKYLTEEQFKELKNDSLIKEWGLRRFIGMPLDFPFEKNQVEIGYSDTNVAHWMFCDPIEGRLPKEGTNEAATDLEVLNLLGVKPEIGTEFTISFDVAGVKTTQTFKLCGWWEKDEIIIANHILIPESRVNAILQELNISAPAKDGMTGSWNLEVMFKNANHISDNLDTILNRHNMKDIPTGVNWGYTGAQLTDNMDPSLVFAAIGMLSLIMLTGYLIIYNVFQISVVGDIRFYGLLKTIGTTGKQIRRIIRNQALALCLVGIPLGLFLGWLVGTQLTPVILSQLNGVVLGVVSVSPCIFLFSTVFALLTVLLSCAKPGRIAAKISPITSVRYTEGQVLNKTRKNLKGISLFRMAIANMGRNRGKTAVTIISLSLSVVLLTSTSMISKGFDMDKYLKDMICDFIVADADYFQTGRGFFDSEKALPETVINDISKEENISAGGRVYGLTIPVEEKITEDYYRLKKSNWYSPEELERVLSFAPRDKNGLLTDEVQLYGMEPFMLDKLEVLEGDLKKLYEPGKNVIAAVYFKDDYGNPEKKTNWAKVGDVVSLRYVDEYEYYYTDTGEVIKDFNESVQNDNRDWSKRAKTYRDVEYTVVAVVEVPSALSYRYYSSDEFVLNNQTFIRDTKAQDILLYGFDGKDETAMEKFMSDYTTSVYPEFAYESKEVYMKAFESTRNMYIILGGVLSFIVALVGILNFFNAILTGIITRKREFAMLQSIGMTGKQLKTMLIYEGVIYALGAIICAFVFSLFFNPLAGFAFESLFWFFTYRMTLTPILAVAPVFVFLGCILPLLVYRSVAKQTIVERLRETDAS